MLTSHDLTTLETCLSDIAISVHFDLGCHCSCLLAYFSLAFQYVAMAGVLDKCSGGPSHHFTQSLMALLHFQPHLRTQQCSPILHRSPSHLECMLWQNATTRRSQLRCVIMCNSCFKRRNGISKAPTYHGRSVVCHQDDQSMSEHVRATPHAELWWVATAAQRRITRPESNSKPLGETKTS